MADDPFNPNEAAEHTAETENEGGLQAKIQSAVGDLKSAASSKADEFRAMAGAKAEELRGVAAAKADELRSAASAKAEEWRGAANAKAEEFRGRAEDAWGDVKIQARTYQEDGEAYVRENPTRSLLIGVTAGFVLGLILHK